MYINVSLIAGLGQAPLVSWNRERESDVVQELLKYSSDKAYGRKGTGFETGLLSSSDWLMLGVGGLLRILVCCKPGARASLACEAGKRSVNTSCSPL